MRIALAKILMQECCNLLPFNYVFLSTILSQQSQRTPGIEAALHTVGESVCVKAVNQNNYYVLVKLLLFQHITQFL